MKYNILLKDIILYLGSVIKNIHGNPEGIEIQNLKNINNTDKYTLDWINSNQLEYQKIAEKSCAQVILCNDSVIYNDIIKKQGKVLIIVDDPKQTIIKVINQFFIEKSDPFIHKTVLIHQCAKIGKNASIGPNVIIGDCIIGDNVNIYGNVVIYDNVLIGDNVEIHNGVSLGSEAHNFIRNTDNRLIKFPHIGRTIIENDVVIGANSVISRGVLEDTIIKEGCKIAQLVFIGANNVIGENCAIRPNAMTSGSVRIGKNSIIAPSSTIREHCFIGERCFIGMGAVVTKDVPAGETWVGNPARKLEK